uniref:Putative nadh dehydrogenase ubiquinone 1 alpha subcomplex assembly factor 4 n=1 Tax=Rhipicephalus microplus TaxID=6941 RepID=A0A6M2CQU3_RHIMP|nr:NADH dehydrogenase [ubiquinone] 1 alpha subcomplex assembly factor 4-like isoform X2 [Rhipicephalus microplus]XP_037280246.1 NADH dehydrogenase [ubiquinone] 1 alpha subcomplex assembly factor 4-like isoform X2 [Rhipicephalus microplus]
MGNRLAAFVGRPVRDFNIENRVERAIGVEKPKAAPRHPSDAKYERTKATTDTSAVKEKREDLLKRLRSVKVVSSSQVQGTVPLKLDRPLPQSRAVPLIQKYGYFEPATIPRGRLTLRQATQMLADVKMDPGTFTAEAVAVQYSLDVRDVREVLHYFSIFRVHSIHLAQRDLTSIDDVKSELLSSRQDSQEGQISDAQNDDTEKKKV